MQQVEIIVALLTVIGIVGALSQKIKIALPILLAVTGMIISLVPFIPTVHLEPDVVFFIFLPPLLYLDAFNTSWKELKNVAEIVTLQAVGLVLVTVAAVAAAIHAVVPDMPWAVAITLGAIVSPTDAVAASAISKEVQLPKRLMDIIKGESLINDATGLVAYQMAVAATLTGAFSWASAPNRFLYVGFGGIVLGLVLGVFLSRIRTKLEHRPVEIITSLLSPFVVYIAAEHLHVSSVLAVVVAGVYLGWRGPLMHSSKTRLQAVATWETIAYVLNGFSFLLMGLQLRPILETVKSYPPLDLFVWTLTAALAPIAIRFIWSYTVTPLYIGMRRTSNKKPNWKHLFVFSWSGMRGVLSLAAALALPLTCADGQPFPFRNLLIFLTVTVIASTLLLQGLTLPAIVKKFGFEPDADNPDEAAYRARLSLAREAVRRIDELSRAEGVDSDDPNLQKLLNHYLERAIAHVESAGLSDERADYFHRLYNEAITAQRRLLIAMRESDQIDEDTFRVLQNELDLEESQIPE
ncbi:MAG: Na+/H+ antiporter [Candidatus Obscuribacter sp.]|nr:Na+/H+ antiporter [Candidatus Obscuribacter sp.]